VANEVERAEAPAVPALAPTPSIEIDSADDIALPALKLGQFMNDHVQEGRVPAGSIFTSLGQDDPDPTVLWEQGNEDNVVFYVLGMRKGKSVSDGGELVLFAYDDPDAPADAWVTYNYVIAIPKVDDEMPVKFLLTRTGRPAAQQINTVLAKNAAAGPPYSLAFALDCVERKNPKGKYFVPRVRHIEADDEEVKVAEKLASLVPSDPVASSGSETTEAPAI